MSARRVSVVGSACVDLAIQTSHLPRAGETVVGGEFWALPGGKGANQAIASARMGAPTEFEGCAGEDAHAHLLRSALAAEGLDPAGLRTVDAPTGVAVLQIDERGENQISQASGANEHVRPRGEYDICVMTLETPFERPSAQLFLLNAAPARTVPLEGVDLLIVNAVEARMLSGESQVPAAHAALVRQGAMRALITLGSEGAWDGAHHPAFPVEAVDTVGAGDAFVGALAAALALELEQPLRWAQAAGALACTRRGAQSAPTRSEIEQFLERVG